MLAESGTSRRTTICQLLHSLTVGGAEVLASRLARQLGERYRFVFLCLDELGELGQSLREDGFQVELLGRRSGVDLRCVRRLKRWLPEHDVDIVHAHQYTPFFNALATRLFGGRLPVLFTEHGRWHPDYPRRKRMLFNRLMLRRRDRVVGVGEAVRQALIKNEGLPPERVSVIYNGVDLERYENTSSENRAAVRGELGVPDRALVLVQVARLDRLKDHLTAVRTMQRVIARRADARLVLVGEGPERVAIEAEIERQGLADHVRLLGLRRDVPRLLAAADVCLLTSISEGIPLTLIEAMAARLPVVSTDVGGVSEVVRTEETGLLAPAKDVEALASAVLQLAGDPARSRRLGDAGHRRAHQLFSEPQMHAAYAELYDEMLSRPPGGRIIRDTPTLNVTS